jgi:hypothetical protein
MILPPSSKLEVSNTEMKCVREYVYGSHTLTVQQEVEMFSVRDHEPITSSTKETWLMESLIEPYRVTVLHYDHNWERKGSFLHSIAMNVHCSVLFWRDYTEFDRNPMLWAKPGHHPGNLTDRNSRAPMQIFPHLIPKKTGRNVQYKSKRKNIQRQNKEENS